MTRVKLNRRAFLSNTGIMLMLPAMESLLPRVAAAQSMTDPRRFVCFYLPNGPYNRPDFPSWTASLGPMGASTNFGAALSPFVAQATDFSVLNGITNKTADQFFNICAGSGHVSNITYLTGNNKIGNTATLASTVTSVDQAIAQAKGKDAWVLNGGSEQAVIGAGEPYDTLAHYLSWKSGVGQLGISNPGDLYRSLIQKVAFNSTPSATPAPSVSGQSLIDGALTDLNRLRRNVSRADQIRLDEYLAGLRALEVSMGSSVQVTPASATCVKPTLDPSVDVARVSDSAGYYKRFKAFNDMIKIAFACDVVRSVAIMMDFEATERPELGAASPDLIYQGADCKGAYKHSISHASESSVVDRYRCVTRDRSYLSMVFDLVSKLKAVTDPSGSRMLDNTMIIAGHGIGDGNHSDCLAVQRTVICAGGKNFLKPGVSYDMKAYDQKDLLYTAQYHLGAGMASFAGSSKLVPI